MLARITFALLFTRSHLNIPSSLRGLFLLRHLIFALACILAASSLVVEKWSDTDFLYAYKINPGPLIAHRDLVYYECWRKDPTTGVVVNVSTSLPEFQGKVPLPLGWIRGNIALHYKRFTPVDEGRSTYYETLQQV